MLREHRAQALGLPDLLNFAALVGQGIDVLGLRREEMSLEDIFVELTTEEPEAVDA